ncbi:MAG: serine/threonine-protein kinase [Pirellulaceae bacterium]|jgi:serine/threonine-protein kinase|nr:serine/threonine-protein kinase [Pirellulaceae bacterium]MDP7020551.1 serine/threonine-protein kinase [Pirellulaceae bacterium]
MDGSGGYSGPDDPTIDAPSPGSTPRSPDDTSLRDGSAPRMHLQEGSSVGLSAQTRDTLRSRLRAASLTMAAGFLTFLVWHIINFDSERIGGLWLLGSHIAVTVTLALCGGSLCRRRQLSSRRLRVEEAIVFTGPAIFFVVWQVLTMAECAEKHHLLPSPTESWLVLIFTYAMFIPNSWRRASLVIAVLAITPTVISLVMISSHAGCATAANADVEFLSRSALLMVVAAVSSVIGVYCIGALRVEAFRAQQLGHYRLRQPLGKGGMGEVYLAEHLLMKRTCAIKIIRPDKAGEPNVLARFEREVRATAQLSHWNNIDIYDYGRADDGTFYYVMEYLPGVNLSTLVQEYGPLAPARAVHLIHQICLALEEAHGEGLIHRDIKPANIFSSFRGGRYDVAKLLDFGLVKPLLSDDTSTQLTQEGSITGSPLFMSPEQASGDTQPDARSDIYSVGCVLYYLLTGRAPFQADKPLQIILAHMSETPAALAQWCDGAPDDLEAIVRRCLEKRPNDRYASARELRQALEDSSLFGEWDADTAAAWWTEHDALPTLDVQESSEFELLSQ